MRLKNLLLALTLTCAAASAPAKAQVPAGPTTRVLAISHYTPGTDISAVLPVLKEEVPATLRLYLAGKIDQWYYRTDQKGVVFILNCATVEEARALLEKLPLGQHHYMEFDYIALGPLTPLGKLIANDPPQSAPK
jgi:hypothetical protein